MQLNDLKSLAAAESYLAVVATTRPDGSIQASVVNAGFLPHPLSGEEVVAFVTYGRTKLANLRARPRVTAVFRSGWNWGAVEGACEIAGPDDPLDGVPPEELPGLIRTIFTAAGGKHDDWDSFDRVMAEERRAAVLIHPDRVYSNRPR